MSRRRRISIGEGREALDACAVGNRDEAVIATAVRFTLEELAECAPGGAIEVRVPPHGAVQCGEGGTHTRGTPPNVVETDAETWLALATGALAWDDAVAAGRVSASGARANLALWLPVARVAP